MLAPVLVIDPPLLPVRPLDDADTIRGMDEVNPSSRYDPSMKGIMRSSSSIRRSSAKSLSTPFVEDFPPYIRAGEKGLFCRRSKEVTGGSNTEDEDEDRFR